MVVKRSKMLWAMAIIYLIISILFVDWLERRHHKVHYLKHKQRGSYEINK